MDVLNEINNKLPKQWAFFGPLWFCWIKVFLGFMLWFVETPFKIFASDLAPAYNLIHFNLGLLHFEQYILFFLVSCFTAFWVMCFGIFFPSFWFMLTWIYVDKAKGKFVWFKIFLFLGFPILYNIYLPKIL